MACKENTRELFLYTAKKLHTRKTLYELFYLTAASCGDGREPNGCPEDTNQFV
jgi:hypothetical protein